MFDLFRSRDKVMRYLLGALLGLVALSLVITLIPGYGVASAPREQVVAEIGGEALTVREVTRAIQATTRGRNLPPEMLPFFVPQVIDTMIAERAIAYQAERMGFKVSDQDVATAIRGMLSQYFPNGDIPQDAYRRFLAQQDISVEDFEKSVRTGLLLNRIENMVLEGVVITPEEVEKEFRRRNDRIKVEYVKVSTNAGDLRSQVTVTPQEIQNQYTVQKARYTTPEKRSWILLSTDEKKVAAGLQVPEAELRAAYSASLDRYRTPERVHARHILIKTADKSPADAQKAEAKANDLLKQLKAGGDFAKLAKENSEDPGSAVKGGDLDWIIRGQTVPNFEKAAFSLKPKELSDVIKTEYGYHIIQVLERQDARVKPFEEVKDEVAAEKQRDAVNNRLQQVVDQAGAELAKAPQNAEQIAAKYGLEVSKVDKAAAGAPIPGVGTSPQLDATVASMKKGEVSQPVEVSPGRIGIVVVTDVFPSHPAELAEVENDIREELIQKKLSELAAERAKQISDKLKAGVAAGTDLATLAKSVGGKVATSDFFNGDATVEGIGPASFLTEAFNKPVGSVVGPVSLGAETIVAKVVDKQTADLAKLPAERETIIATLKRQRASERKELLDDGILTQLIKEGKVKKFTDTINRITQSYRG